MKTPDRVEELQRRKTPLDMSPETVRELGYAVVDKIADLLAAMPERPVTPGETPAEVRALIGASSPLPESGRDPRALLDETADLLIEHSLYNGHPRFFGFITSPPAPIGVLADLLAAAVNPNVGGWVLSPVASEIERQTVRWIAEMIGYPADCGGLLVSGGNMANFVGFLAARKAKAPWDVRTLGVAGKPSGALRVYASQETHTWIQKAADLFGLGTNAVRSIPTDDKLRMDAGILRRAIGEDKRQGDVPLLVVGTAGSVSTGAIDPLPEIGAICREHDVWFHVDGAYGGFAAALPDASPDLRGLREADSVAVDPHKWLYAPLEAGCALVRDPEALHTTFSYHPAYYHQPDYERDPPIHYHEYGMQNSRGFRALKVWLALRQAGRDGYARMIADDIRLAEELYRAVAAEPSLEPATLGLSIVTFRYVPPDLRTDGSTVESYLNDLNEELLNRLQSGGQAFLSNAVIAGRFLLRACIVNFRTSLDDVRALPGVVTRLGATVDEQMRRGRG